MQDVALALGLMANSGIKSGMSGRSLRQIMSGLNGGIELVTKSTKAWRIESANADGSTRSLKALLDDLRVAFADMTDEQKAMNAEAIAGECFAQLYRNIFLKIFDKIGKD